MHRRGDLWNTRVLRKWPSVTVRPGQEGQGTFRLALWGAWPPCGGRWRALSQVHVGGRGLLPAARPPRERATQQATSGGRSPSCQLDCSVPRAVQWGGSWAPSL